MQVQKLILILLCLCFIAWPVMAFAQTSSDVSASNPAAPVEKHNGGQLTVSAFVVLFMNWLKKSRLAPWVTTETEKINRTLAIALSGLAALGVHATFDSGAGTLVVTGLTLTGIVQMALAWGKSYVFQQTIFNMTKQN